MSWDRYFAPFSYGLWLAVAAAACALSVCLALTACGHGRNQGRTVPAVFFYISACFCQQGQKIQSTYVAFLLYLHFLMLLSYTILQFSSFFQLKFNVSLAFPPFISNFEQDLLTKPKPSFLWLSELPPYPPSCHSKTKMDSQSDSLQCELNGTFSLN
jgi:hypothetical protein